jgi:hypothetical protein
MNGFLKATGNCKMINCGHQQRSETHTYCHQWLSLTLLDGSSDFLKNWHNCEHFERSNLKKILLYPRRNAKETNLKTIRKSESIVLIL